MFCMLLINFGRKNRACILSLAQVMRGHDLYDDGFPERAKAMAAVEQRVIIASVHRYQQSAIRPDGGDDKQEVCETLRRHSNSFAHSQTAVDQSSSNFVRRMVFKI